MNCHTRTALLAVAAVGVLGVSTPITTADPTTEVPTGTEAPTTTTTTTQSSEPPTPTTPITEPACCTVPPTTSTTAVRPMPEATLAADPSSVERGASVTISGSNWRCDQVTIKPQRSEAVTAGTSEESFAKAISVPPDAEFGPYSITVTCARTQLTRTVTIQIARPPTDSPTTSADGGPVSEVDAQSSDSQIALPPAAPPSESRPISFIDDALALGALLVAIAVATFVLRHRGKRAHRPTEPHLRVHVIEGPAPTIQVHRTGTTPTVRVRLFGGDPLLQIREIPQ